MSATLRALGTVLLFREAAPANGRDLKRRKQGPGDARRVDPLGHVPGAEVHLRAVAGAYARERAAALAPVQVVRPRHAARAPGPVPARRLGLAQPDQALRLRIGKRTEQPRVDAGEQRRRDADPERHAGDRGAGQRAVSDDGAERVAQIVRQRVHGRPPPESSSTCRAARARGRQAARSDGVATVSGRISSVPRRLASGTAPSQERTTALNASRAGGGRGSWQNAQTSRASSCATGSCARRRGRSASRKARPACAGPRPG